MSNKLKAHVDPLAGGPLTWYMAGGGAAWWHISTHMYTWHGAHDWTYFDSVKSLIFPGDVEGGALSQVTTTFPSKEGEIDVTLSETAKNKFDEIVGDHCEEIDGILVFGIDSIIARYRTAGNPRKKDKRDIRVGMLHLIQKGLPITPAGVEQYKPKGGGLLAGIGSLKLKPIK